MDKAYMKLGKEASKLKKDVMSVEKKDHSRDKLVKAGKKAMSKKGKSC